MEESQLGCFGQKGQTCNLRGKSGARQTAFLFVHGTELDPPPPPQLPPTNFAGLLLSGFPQCGQSADVLKLNLSTFPTSPSPTPFACDTVSDGTQPIPHLWSRVSEWRSPSPVDRLTAPNIQTLTLCSYSWILMFYSLCHPFPCFMSISAS